MNGSVRDFASHIRNYDSLTSKPAQLVPFLAHLLEEHSNGEAVTGRALLGLFEELRVRRPARISDVLGKSDLFVRARAGGYRLSHKGRQYVLSGLESNIEPKIDEGSRAQPLSFEKAPSSATLPSGPSVESHFSPRNVLVVYGRNKALRRDLFALLRALGLHPFEFEEMAQHTGSASPYTWEVLETAFKNVQACVVLFSPDETVSLRPELREKHDDDEKALQPRPNVLIEAGMALALQPKRTILVKVGNVRQFSDFDGKQYVSLTGSAESRNKLRGRLQMAGCDVKSNGDDWLTIGDFNIKDGRTK
jgi:predicted nucleotide-binding protein